MTRLRTLILIGALSLAVGWLGGRVSAPVAPDASAIRSSGPRPLGMQPAKAAPLAERLRQRMDERPRSQRNERNPFTFGAHRPSPAARRPADRPDESRPAVTEDAAAPIVAAPRFKLSGIASDRKDGAPHFTAILTDYGTLVFAEEGSELSGGYRVERVDEHAVVLVDASGRETELRLP